VAPPPWPWASFGEKNALDVGAMRVKITRDTCPGRQVRLSRGGTIRHRRTYCKGSLAAPGKHFPLKIQLI
jgi:hypothetical protein